mgnify:CR=1 FL=1
MLVNLVLNNFINDSRVQKTSLFYKKKYGTVLVVALHDGKLPVKDSVNGLDVYRIKITSKKLFKIRILQVFKFVEFTFRFIIKFRNTKILVCNDLNALLVGAIYKLFYPNVIIFYDSHEFAINDVPNQKWYSIKVRTLLEGSIINCASEVFTVSDSIAAFYVKLYGIKKPSVILNCPVYREIKKTNKFREIFPIQQHQKIFLYQGMLIPGRGLEFLVENFISKKDSDVLIIMGDGILSEYFKDIINPHSNIHYHSAVPQSSLLSYTSSADFGICFIEDLCMSYRYCLPNKIFEYIMAGIPVLSSNLPEIKQLVAKNKIGCVVGSQTVESFNASVSQIKALNHSKFNKSILAIRNQYNWEKQEEKLDEILQKYI